MVEENVIAMAVFFYGGSLENLVISKYVYEPHKVVEYFSDQSTSFENAILFRRQIFYMFLMGDEQK